MTRFVRAAVAASALLLAAPAAGASATIPGLRSSGTLVVKATMQGTPVTVGGRVALYHKGPLYRLDVLSLGIPGAGSELSAAASQLIAPGGVSVVYDGATGSITAWSNANRTYYFDAHERRETSVPSAAAPPNAGDPLGALANVASALRDVQSASIQLTGHSVVNGHPSTDLDVQVRREAPGQPPESYHVQAALADDLGDFPLQIAFQSSSANKSTLGMTAKLDLTTVQRDVPDDATFEAPQGYTRVKSLSGVLRVPH